MQHSGNTRSVRYSNDTRSIEPGSYYVAIEGEKYDGHDFVDDAIRKGAAGLVVEKDIGVDVPADVEVIRVEDSERYLAEQARQKLERIAPEVVAITGSVGKTSTKNAVVAVLEQSHHVVPSVGNLNTILGLSITLLNAEFTGDSKLVLEMGATHAGDIAAKTEYFRPTVSVVTNVQGVHLSSFGSIEVIAQTKGELVEALSADGIACLNYDDPRVRAMADRNRGRTIFYGKDDRCDVRPEVIGVEIPLLGEHAVYTALAAYAVGRALGASDESIERGILELKPEKGRLNKLAGVNDITLIDDSYNASPAAVESALAAMRKVPGSRYVVFLGDMLELGEGELEEHARVIRAALERADHVVLAGELMSAAASMLPGALREQVVLHPTSTDIAEGISQGRIYEPTPGDVVLVKGSQGSRMERISKVLLHPDLEPADVLPRQSLSWQSA